MRAVLSVQAATWSDVWQDATGTQPAPRMSVVAAAVALALALVVIPRAWRVARHALTIAHEGAHGVVALLVGRSLEGIRVHSDTSGLAVSRGKPRGPGMVATVAAGYVGPALIGLGAAALLGRGHALGVLWLAVLLLALLTLKIRNLYGFAVVLAAGAGVFAVSWWGQPDVQVFAAYAGTAFLLLGAPRPVLELQRARRRGRAPNSDADVLARLTHLPGIVWVASFLVVTVGCAIAGAWLIAPQLR